MKTVDVVLSEKGRLGSQLAERGLVLEDLLEYMRRGTLISCSKELQPDPLDPQAPPIAVFSLSDGEWVWGWDARCLARRYGVAFPEDFLDRIRLSRHADSVAGER